MHLLALCTALYFAPQIQAYVQGASSHHHDPEQDGVQTQAQPDGTTNLPNAPPQVAGGDADNAFNPDDTDFATDSAGPHQANQEANDQHQQPFLNNDNSDDDDENEEPNFDNPDAANAGPARPIPTARNVGAKKARSLARRDQRRAYHEFQRSQGEAQRAADAAGAAERDALAREERARRAAAEAELKAREAREREQRRERERLDRAEEMAARERAVAVVREEVRLKGVCDLELVAARAGRTGEREWVERLVRASGLLNTRESTEGEVMLLTEKGWVVRVTRSDMDDAYRAAMSESRIGSNADGTLAYSDLGAVLERVLENRAAIAAR